jgi:hypothetical protein
MNRGQSDSAALGGPQQKTLEFKEMIQGGISSTCPGGFGGTSNVNNGPV